MKWVKIRDGVRKLVDDDDPRPEDIEFSNRKSDKPISSFTVVERPPWDIRTDIHKISTDSDANTAYTEATQLEKKKWSSRGKWARWEKERKAHAMANKSTWIKRGARMEERNEAING